METSTHTAPPVALDRLVRRFAEMKEYLPKSRLSRWEAYRLMFGIHSPVKVWPATNALWQLKDYGEKTRARWIEEYRHQRQLSAIARGTDYETNA
jgi:hypothetical protein